MSKILKLLPAIAWTVLVYWLCLLPKSELPTNKWFDFEGFDKIVHFVFYSIMFFLYYFALQKSRKQTIGIAIFCIAVGVSIEFLQGYLPINRSFDVWDIVANAIGMLCSVGVLWRIKNRKFKR